MNVQEKNSANHPTGEQLSFLDTESKAILSGISHRLNDIDLKLTLVLEHLVKHLPDQPPVLEACSINEKKSEHPAKAEQRCSPAQQENTGRTSRNAPLISKNNSDALALEGSVSGDSERAQAEDPQPETSNNKEDEGEEEESEDYYVEMEEVPFKNTL